MRGNGLFWADKCDFLIEENQISLSGTKLRLIGHEIAQVGLTDNEIKSVENKFYSEAKNKSKELPASAYSLGTLRRATEKP